MDVKIPSNVAAIQSYEPGETLSQLKKKFGWEKVAVLWNNENTLGTSPKAVAAIKEVLGGLNFYPDPASTSLKKRIAHIHNRSLEQVIVGNGSESILMMAIKSMCEGEDEFLTSEGTFAIMYNWAKINKVRPVAVPLTDAYSFDLEAMKRRVNRNTKIIYLANVNNPTGTMITREELLDFIGAVPGHILIIIDEAYIEYSKSLHSDFPDSLELDYPNILTVRSMSKAYGIAGIRLGFAIGNEQIIKAMTKAKLTFEPSVLAQAAGIGALQDEDFVRASIDNNKKGMTYLMKEFERLGVRYISGYGNFLMTTWGSEQMAVSMQENLMKKGVLVRMLGGNLAHCIRISIGNEHENKWLIENLNELMPLIN